MMKKLLPLLMALLLTALPARAEATDDVYVQATVSNPRIERTVGETDTKVDLNGLEMRLGGGVGADGKGVSLLRVTVGEKTALNVAIALDGERATLIADGLSSAVALGGANAGDLLGLGENPLDALPDIGRAVTELITSAQTRAAGESLARNAFSLNGVYIALDARVEEKGEDGSLVIVADLHADKGEKNALGELRVELAAPEADGAQALTATLKAEAPLWGQNCVVSGLCEGACRIDGSVMSFSGRAAATLERENTRYALSFDLAMESATLAERLLGDLSSLPTLDYAALDAETRAELMKEIRALGANALVTLMDIEGLANLPVGDLSVFLPTLGTRVAD